MRQRVGIAQALLNDPRLLIVDEPTAGLDPEERVRFRNLLGELSGDRIVILSTHIVSDVEAAATRIAVLRRGRLVADAAPEALLAEVRGRVWEWSCRRRSSVRYGAARSGAAAGGRRNARPRRRRPGRGSDAAAPTSRTPTCGGSTPPSRCRRIALRACSRRRRHVESGRDEARSRDDGRHLPAHLVATGWVVVRVGGYRASPLGVVAQIRWSSPLSRSSGSTWSRAA
jgi:ABC-type glutathione transport system ATPase component